MACSLDESKSQRWYSEKLKGIQSNSVALINQNKMLIKEIPTGSDPVKNWKTSAAGNEYIINSGLNIVVFKQDANWVLRIMNLKTKKCTFSKPYSTCEEAKSVALKI